MTLTLLTASGCSHSYAFSQTPDLIGTAQNHKLKSHTLAMDLSGVPETYAARIQGSTFDITGIRLSAAQTVHKMFATERWVEDRTQADYVLKLVLELDLQPNFGGTRCGAKAHWDILQGEKVAGSGTASGSADYPAMANGGRNCELAYMASMSKALDAALAQL